MTVIARAILFLSSYAPLLTLFWLLESFPPWIGRACLLIAVVSSVALFSMWFFLRSVLQSERDEFQGARSRDSEVMAYVVSYVVPFAAAADSTDASERAALALFAVLIAVLYIRSAVFYVHPLLLLVGIHVYEATRHGTPVIVLTRSSHLRQTTNLRVVSFAPNVYVEKDG